MLKEPAIAATKTTAVRQSPCDGFLQSKGRERQRDRGELYDGRWDIGWVGGSDEDKDEMITLRQFYLVVD